MYGYIAGSKTRDGSKLNKPHTVITRVICNVKKLSLDIATWATVCEESF